MRETTRQMRETLNNDLLKMKQHNNSKSKRRTDVQNEQSKSDRIDYFTRKWEKIRETAETDAQKKYCEIALDAVSRIR